MKLIDVVNNILSDMNSFPVSSIADDVEAEQVANIVKNTYDYLITMRRWPSSRNLIRLQSSAEPSRPTHMRLPDEVVTVDTVRYNVSDETDEVEYRLIKQVSPEEFLMLTNSRKSSNDNVRVVDDSSGIPLKVLNDTYPEYYTSFDDEYLVFDAYPSDDGNTLQSNKTIVMAYSYPAFVVADDHEINLPDTVLQLLIAEAKSHCFITLKQAPNEKEEQRARRLSAWLSKERFRNGEQTYRYPNYGRK